MQLDNDMQMFLLYTIYS